MADVLSCNGCHKRLRQEDWNAPLQPFQPGRCINCGERRIQDVCEGCGLTQQEDVQVHEELRVLAAPTHNLLHAARATTKQGRRLIALKLATAALTTNEEGQGESAQALRIWLLSAIGETSSALEEAKRWVEGSPNPSALSLATLGQQLYQSGYPGASADAYARSIDKDPSQLPIRARRAKILVSIQREGQALTEVTHIFKSSPDKATLATALEVTETLCNMYQNRHRDDEVVYLIQQVGPYIDHSAVLLAHWARIEATRGNSHKAHKYLKKARALLPEHPMYQQVETLAGPLRSGWWPW